MLIYLLFQIIKGIFVIVECPRLGIIYINFNDKNMAIINSKFSIKTIGLVATSCLVLSFSSCCGESGCKTDSAKQVAVSECDKVQAITAQEVADAQKAWGDGVVAIGKVFTEKGDYTKVAADHVKKFYNYDEGTVLFKPTLASQKQFRLDFEGALSYFVGGNENYPEDHGFAIKPWTKVRFENAGTIIDKDGDTALAMGNYFFTPADGSPEVKVEYTFAYKKDKDGNLKIISHGSHLPYSPAH